MTLLQDQNYISKQQPMPVDDMTTSSSIQSISGETVQLYYSNSGTRTIDAGQAAGTAVAGQLANKNIFDSAGSAIGTYKDTSLTFTSTAFTNERPFPYGLYKEHKNKTWAAKLSAITTGFSQGDYCVDYRSGAIYGVKASTQVTLTSTAYKINQAQTGVGGGASTTINDLAVSATTLIGKPSTGDFTTAYASATTITLGTYPDGSSVKHYDIVSVVQIATGGTVTAIYMRDDKAMSISANVLTVTGASFAASDNFVVYTNVRKVYDLISGEDTTHNVMKTEQQFTATRVTGDTQIKGAAGFVHAITISPTTATPTAGLLTVYDNTAESGTILFSEWVFATTPAHTVIINGTAATGIYVGYDASLANVSCTVSWR